MHHQQTTATQIDSFIYRTCKYENSLSSVPLFSVKHFTRLYICLFFFRKKPVKSVLFYFFKKCYRFFYTKRNDLHGSRLFLVWFSIFIFPGIDDGEKASDRKAIRLNKVVDAAKKNDRIGRTLNRNRVRIYILILCEWYWCESFVCVFSLFVLYI